MDVSSVLYVSLKRQEPTRLSQSQTPSPFHADINIFVGDPKGMVGWRLEQSYWQGSQAAVSVMWVSDLGFTGCVYRRKSKVKSKL
jgi:hypothetical protein